MTFYVYTKSYCGMTLKHGEFEGRKEAHHRAKARREWVAKQGAPITVLSPQSWEIEEPVGCMMVPDFCGTLRVSTTAPSL